MWNISIGLSLTELESRNAKQNASEGWKLTHFSYLCMKSVFMVCSFCWCVEDSSGRGEIISKKIIFSCGIPPDRYIHTDETVEGEYGEKEPLGHVVSIHDPFAY